MNVRSVIKLLALQFLLMTASVAQEANPLLVIRPAGPDFEAAKRGLSEELDADFSIHELVINRKTEPSIVAVAMAQISPRVVVLMDNTCIDLYRNFEQSLDESVPIVPVIACMGVGLATGIQGLKKATGISYEVPIVTSLVGLRSSINRRVSRIGILYREQMREFIRHNAHFCFRENIEVVEYMLPDSLRSFAPLLQSGLSKLLTDEKVDALWLANDNLLLTPQLITDVWVPTIKKHRVPVVVGAQVLVLPSLGLGSFAVLPDHLALGIQVAGMVIDLEDKNWDVTQRPIEYPLSVRKFVNGHHMAKFFGLKPNSFTTVDSVLLSDESQESVISAGEDAIFDRLSLTGLLNMKVTSVSKKAERLMDVPTSIYVLTRDDIERSGAARLIDLLHFVPGVFTSERNFASTYLTVRNAGGEAYSMTVNVLVDGVPVYNPVTGGVFSEGLNVPVQNIDRIEVIKGSGGTIYGANSATGVVSIFTRNARQQPGLEVSLAGGTQAFLHPYVRYATPLGPRGAIAADASLVFTNGYAKNPDFTPDSISGVNDLGVPFTVANKFPRDDDRRYVSAMLTADLDYQFLPWLSFVGHGWYSANRVNGYTAQIRPFPDTFFPGIPEDSIWMVKARYDNFALSGKLNGLFGQNHQGFCHVYLMAYPSLDQNAVGAGTFHLGYRTVDFEVQDNLRLFADRPLSMELISGFNTRTLIYDISNSPPRFVNPHGREYISALFTQAKWTLLDNIDLTAGLKAEVFTLIDGRPFEAWRQEGRSVRNYLKNYPEYSPSVRLAGRVNERLALWSAWSRSTSVPSYLTTNMEYPAQHLPPDWAWQFYQTWQAFGYDYGPGDTLPQPPAGAGKWLTMVGKGSLQPSHYSTTELGLRAAILPQLTLDHSMFYSLYQGEITDLPFDIDYTVPSRINNDSIVPIYLGNLANGYSMGLETIIRSQPHRAVRIEGSYSFLYYILDSYAGDTEKGEEITMLHAPAHIVRLRCYTDLPRDIRLTVNSDWHSAYEVSYPYDYQQQKMASLSQSRMASTGPGPGVRLDFNIDKQFFDNRLMLSLWGRNMLVKDRIDSYLWYLHAYPQTVGRSVGLQARYRW